MIVIQEEQAGGAQQIWIANLESFDRMEGANLEEKLRLGCIYSISLVALPGDQIVGLILFTSVTILAAERIIVGMGSC